MMETTVTLENFTPEAHRPNFLDGLNDSVAMRKAFSPQQIEDGASVRVLNSQEHPELSNALARVVKNDSKTSLLQLALIPSGRQVTVSATKCSLALTIDTTTSSRSVEKTPPFPSPGMSDGSSPVPAPNFDVIMGESSSSSQPTAPKERVLTELHGQSSKPSPEAISNSVFGFSADNSENAPVEPPVVVVISRKPVRSKRLVAHSGRYATPDHSKGGRSSRNHKESSELTKKKQRARMLIGKYCFVSKGRQFGHIGFVRRGGNGYFNVDIVGGNTEGDHSAEDLKNTTVMKRSGDLHGLDLSEKQIEMLQAAGGAKRLRTEYPALFPSAEELQQPSPYRSSTARNTPRKKPRGNKRKALSQAHSRSSNRRKVARVSIQAKTVHHENTLQTEQSRRSLDIKSAAEILIGISHREEEQQEHTQQQSGKECLKKGSFRTHHNSKRTTRHSSHMQDLEFASGATHIVNDRPYSKVIVPSISQLPTVLPPELEDDSSAHSTPSLTGFGNMGVDMLMLTL